MDDWSLNFLSDAARSPYEVETCSPSARQCVAFHDRGLSDLAQAHPEAVDRIPALTLARRNCLAWKNTAPRGGGRRGDRLQSQTTAALRLRRASLRISRSFTPDSESSGKCNKATKRWMTLGTEPDGSMTEIGDEGHMEMPCSKVTFSRCGDR